MKKNHLDRYARHISLSEIGIEGQHKILKARVLVVGAGGLGSPVLQYLAAAGVGTLGVVDFDVVDKTNLQRQILYGVSSLGKSKVLSAAHRLRDLNDEIDIVPHELKIERREETVELFSNYDIMVDGTDNSEARYLINDACVALGKPFVYAAVYKFEGQVSVFNYRNGPTYRCLFPQSPKDMPSCNIVGVLGVVLGVLGSMQSCEVLKIILNLGDVLSGRVLRYDALTHRIRFFTLSRATDFQAQKESTPHKENLCIAVEDLPLFERVIFIDVRTPEEVSENEVHSQISDVRILRIPVHKIRMDRKGVLDILTSQGISVEKHRLVTYCSTGVRSEYAAGILRSMGYEKSFSLKGGVDSIRTYSNKRII